MQLERLCCRNGKLHTLFVVVVALAVFVLLSVSIEDFGAGGPFTGLSDSV